MEQLNGQVGVVTGASGGLGRSIALALAAAGMKVVAASRDVTKLATLQEEIVGSGGGCLTVSTDVSDESAVRALFTRIREEYGRVDLLVNNAGLAVGGPADELSFELWRQVLSVNLDGAFLCSRAALAMMKPQKRGRIINIGSVSAKVPRIHSAPYTTSKFALEGMTRAMALDARAYGVAVGILHPGNTDTPIWDSRREVGEGEGLMPVDEVARMVVTMASLPPTMNFLEGIVLPVSMPFLGRG